MCSRLAPPRFGAWRDRLETELGAGPSFNGLDLALVDCAFAPLRMRATLLELHLYLGVFTRRPRLRIWSETLLGRDALHQSVAPDFPEQLINSRRSQAPLGRKLFGEPPG